MRLGRPLPGDAAEGPGVPERTQAAACPHGSLRGRAGVRALRRAHRAGPHPRGRARGLPHRRAEHLGRADQEPAGRPRRRLPEAQSRRRVGSGAPQGPRRQPARAVRAGRAWSGRKGHDRDHAHEDRGDRVPVRRPQGRGRQVHEPRRTRRLAAGQLPEPVGVPARGRPARLRVFPRRGPARSTAS